MPIVFCFFYYIAIHPPVHVVIKNRHTFLFYLSIEILYWIAPWRAHNDDDDGDIRSSLIELIASQVQWLAAALTSYQRQNDLYVWKGFYRYGFFLN